MTHHRRLRAKYRNDLKGLEAHYRSHGCNARASREAEVHYLDFDNALKIWVEMKVEAAEVSEEAAEALRAGWLEGSGFAPAVKTFLPPTLGAVTPARVVADLKRGGTVHARLVSRGGTDYIVFRGNHRLRRLITGTRYRLDNTRVVKMGFGRAGAKMAARGNVLISVFVCGGINGARWMVEHDYTWRNFVADMTVDLGVAVLSAAVGLAVILSSGAAAVAVGPVLIAVGVSLLAGIGLGLLADHLKLSEKILRVLESSKVSYDKGTWDGSPVYYEHEAVRLPGEVERIRLDRLIHALTGHRSWGMGRDRKSPFGSGWR